MRAPARKMLNAQEKFNAYGRCKEVFMVETSAQKPKCRLLLRGHKHVIMQLNVISFTQTKAWLRTAPSTARSPLLQVLPVSNRTSFVQLIPRRCLCSVSTHQHRPRNCLEMAAPGCLHDLSCRGRPCPLPTPAPHALSWHRPHLVLPSRVTFLSSAPAPCSGRR